MRATHVRHKIARLDHPCRPTTRTLLPLSRSSTPLYFILFLKKTAEALPLKFHTPGDPVAEADTRCTAGAPCALQSSQYEYVYGFFCFVLLGMPHACCWPLRLRFHLSLASLRMPLGPRALACIVYSVLVLAQCERRRRRLTLSKCAFESCSFMWVPAAFVCEDDDDTVTAPCKRVAVDSTRSTAYVASHAPTLRVCSNLNRRQAIERASNTYTCRAKSNTSTVLEVY